VSKLCPLKGHITASQDKDSRGVGKHTSSRRMAVLRLCWNQGCSNGLIASNALGADTDNCSHDECMPWLQSSVSAPTVLLIPFKPSWICAFGLQSDTNSDTKTSLDELQVDQVDKLAKSNTDTADLQLLRRCFSNSDTKISLEELHIYSVSIAFGQLVHFI